MSLASADDGQLRELLKQGEGGPSSCGEAVPSSTSWGACNRNAMREQAPGELGVVEAALKRMGMR